MASGDEQIIDSMPIRAASDISAQHTARHLMTPMWPTSSSRLERLYVSIAKHAEDFSNYLF